MAKPICVCVRRINVNTLTHNTRIDSHLYSIWTIQLHIVFYIFNNIFYISRIKKIQNKKNSCKIVFFIRKKNPLKQELRKSGKSK